MRDYLPALQRMNQLDLLKRASWAGRRAYRSYFRETSVEVGSQKILKELGGALVCEGGGYYAFGEMSMMPCE